MCIFYTYSLAQYLEYENGSMLATIIISSITIFPGLTARLSLITVFQKNK